MNSVASALLVVVSFSTPLLAFDEVIRVEPARPSSTERIRVTVSGTWTNGCTPRFERFDRGDGEGALLFTAARDVPCPANMPPWSQTTEIGPLREGAWKLRAVVDGVVIAETSFEVVPGRHAFEIIPSSARLEGGTPVRIRPGYSECSLLCQEYRVLFDGVPGTVVGASGRDVDVIPPPHAGGRVDVTIHTTNGGTITREDAFLYYDVSAGPPPDAFETILVPLMFEGEGAFGSEWTSELMIRNRSDQGVDPWNPIVRCGPTERCHPQIPAGATLRLSPALLMSWIHGYLLAVPREQADDLDFMLHIRDLSRQAESFGTEIPVVRERELPRSPVTLLGVPVGERGRVMLRIYDTAAVDGTPVVIRYRLDDGTQYGGDIRLMLRTVARCVAAPCWLPDPAGIALPLFGAPLPPNLTQDHLHLEVEALMPYSRLWAMVTVTNNETQQVTTITPQ